MTPDTDLVHFQSVTVVGSDFQPSSYVQFAQCTSDADSYDDCVSTGAGLPLPPTVVAADGTFSTSVLVRRVLHLEEGDVDCASAPDACSIMTTVAGGPNARVVATPISFDASAPLPPPPTISVTPAVDLVNGQTVAVTGADFAPGEMLVLSECLTGQIESCSYGGRVITADATGAFSASFTARRGVAGGEPFSVVDCASAPQQCSVVAFGFSAGDLAAQPVDFDPSVPLPTPVVSVTPQFDLADRAVVHVHASGLPPGDHIMVSECPADAPKGPFVCGKVFPPAILTADADGEIDTHLRVQRDLPAGYFGFVIIDDATTDAAGNCADAVGTCIMRVQSLDDLLVGADVPLGFDPTAVAPPPALTLTPAGPFVDGQSVEVHGSGFTPSALLGMAQCRPDTEGCDNDSLYTEFRADGEGNFTRTITMHQQYEGNGATPVDCREPGACVLFAANRQDYAAERTSIPVVVGDGSSEFVAAPDTRALAFTGSGGATLPIAITGVALVLLGGVLVLLGRRRTPV